MIIISMVSFIFAVLFILILISFMFRRVVATNEVHIVQCAKATTSYGKDTKNGNTYYEWPSFLPIIGVSKIVLPTSVFDLDLINYEAYDRGRLPFVVDIKAFFRVEDSNIAAQRVSNFKELETQLEAVVQGAVRTILASSDIEEIMQGRSKFGDEFTKEVQEQMINWGVTTVKTIELMDIRDSKNGHVIHDIMEKKKSLIEMESRREVASNHKQAEISEIEAQREVDVQQQQAKQVVGLREVETNQQVELAKQAAQQAIKIQEKITVEKTMEIKRVQDIQSAEIEKAVQIVKAEQEKDSNILKAEGKLEMSKREAEGIKIEGQAKAEAESAMQLAPINAQISLAKEIGDNQGYQQYLITIEKIKAGQVVGLEQAKALTKAEIKIITNASNPNEGMTKVMDLFSSAGGQAVGSMLEGLAQTETGKKILEKVTKKKNIDT